MKLLNMFAGAVFLLIGVIVFAGPLLGVGTVCVLIYTFVYCVKMLARVDDFFSGDPHRFRPPAPVKARPAGKPKPPNNGKPVKAKKVL